MERISKVSFFGYIFLIYGLFLMFCPVVFKKYKPRMRMCHLLSEDMAKVQSRYLSGGKLEHVSFLSHESEDSDVLIKRDGFLLRRPGAQATVLVCHGYMCDKFDTGLFRMLFTHFNVMTFDFRAHGIPIDESQCCTFGKDEALDVIGAAKFIKSDIDLAAKPLIAYGFSMGAVAAITAQSKQPDLFTALILDCPYDKAENILKNALSQIKITLFGYEFDVPGCSYLEQYAFNPYVQRAIKSVLKTVAHLDATRTNTQIFPLNPVESVKNITVPCFFIHCSSDEKVPVSAGKMVYQNAKGYKRMWITQGRWHFDSFFFNPEKYMYKVNTFIRHVLSHEVDKKLQEKIVHDV